MRASEQEHTECDERGVVEPNARTKIQRRFQLGSLGLVFVSAAALLLLVSIVDERLGLLERAFAQVPGWLAFVLVGAGGYPIFRGLVRDLRRRHRWPPAPGIDQIQFHSPWLWCRLSMRLVQNLGQVTVSGGS